NTKPFVNISYIFYVIRVSYYFFSFCTGVRNYNRIHAKDEKVYRRTRHLLSQQRNQLALLIARKQWQRFTTPATAFSLFPCRPYSASSSSILASMVLAVG